MKLKLILLGVAVCMPLSVLAKTIALKNINIIDVKLLKIINNQTIIIKDNKIDTISPQKTEIFDKNVIVIDMSDKYVIPGLIDSHVHHATVPDSSDNDDITRMRLRNLLRGGVTSVRDMGGDTRVLSSLKRRAEIDVIQSPDIYYSVIIGGEEFFADPRTVASAQGRTPGFVDWMKAVDENTNFDEVMLRALGTGATGIKIYAKVPANVIEMLSLSAKKHGLKVWSHAFVGPARPNEAVNAGVETISHAPDLSAEVISNFYELRRQGKQITEQQQRESFELSRYQSLITDMKKHNTILDATMTIFELKQVSRGERGALMHKWSKTFTKLAYENGIKISTGTDGSSDYFDMNFPLVHHEMQLLVNEVGLSPLEAIQAATLHGAQVIGIDDDYGEIKTGKIANLVILNDDPSKKIENVLNIAHVVKNGEFVYLGEDKKLPFTSARAIGDTLWLSGQLGNIPSTMTLASESIEGQMTQTMKNIGVVLQEHNLNFEDIAKCTLMLANIDDWQAANKAYIPFFEQLPARSAFATTGLALGAKVEVECVAKL